LRRRIGENGVRREDAKGTDQDKVDQRGGHRSSSDIDTLEH
jgi:hypothetical protein